MDLHPTPPYFEILDLLRKHINNTHKLSFMLGARVILACRDQARADAAAKDIVNQTGNNNVVVGLLDLSSLESVREFSKNIINTEQRLDILINNAGNVNI